MSFKNKSKGNFVKNVENKVADKKIYKGICIHFNKAEYDQLYNLAKSENRSLLNTIKHALLTYRAN
jgi:hypothetical protein